MAKLFNRAKVNTATAGTGTITLGSAYSNAFCTFAEAGVANTDVVAYVIEDGTDFEIGIGTYTSAGTTLSRDTVRLSKIAGTAGTTKLTLSGSAIVYLSPGKEDIFNIAGTITNDSATTGQVGEFVSNVVSAASAVAITTGTAKTVTSISLTAGDWDVFGTIAHVPAAGTTVSQAVGAINTVDNTLPSDLTTGLFSTSVPTTGGQGNLIASLSTKRYSLSGTTTIYLIAFATFAVSTNAAYGYIGARRVR